MLHLLRHPHTGEIRLYLRSHFSAPMRAFIAYRRPERGEEPDWRLWIERPGSPRPSTAPCQLLLEARSHLRAWLLQRHRRRLHAVRFADLRALASERHPRAHTQ